MTKLETIFEPAIRIATGDPRADWAAGPPDEEAALRRASPKRLREFRAGRSLARKAMRDLGLPPAPIFVAMDRSPTWPEGLAGSISHCDDLCAAALALSSDGYLSIGIDIEPAVPLDAVLLDDICNEEERDWLACLPEARRGLYARAIFSAKECAYKCQYTLSKQLLDFHAMTVSMDLDTFDFVARFNEEAKPFRKGNRLRGRFAIGLEHIVTGMALNHERLSAMRSHDEAVPVVAHA